MNHIKNHNILFAWFGILAVAAFSIAWIAAAALDPTWVFGKNMISDLGVSSTDAKYYFNYGCVITGALIVVFGFGNTPYAKNHGNRTGGLLLVAAGVFLALVGIFTENVGNGNLHITVAVLLALFALCAITASAAGDWHNHHEMLAGLSVALVFIVAITYFTCDLALFEAYAVIAGLIWLTVESVRMILDA